MNKTLFFAGIAAAALLASCTKEVAPRENLPVCSIKLDLMVSDLQEPASKAVKTGWQAGDVIDIWYDANVQKAPDLVARFDGSVWNVESSATVSGNAPSSSGSLNAVYVSAGNIAGYGWSGGASGLPGAGAGFTCPVHEGTVDGQENPAVSDLIVFSQKQAYTFADGVLRASLDSWKYLSNTQIVVSGEGLQPGDWALKCDKLKTVSGFNFANGVPGDAIYAGDAVADSYAFGQANADGLAFYFLADSESSQDYVFTLYNLSGPEKYTYTASAKTLNTDASQRNAVKIAQTKFAGAAPAGTDYYQDYLDGKDIVIGTKTINRTTYPNAALISEDITVAALQTQMDSYPLLFIENGVTIAQNGGTTTLIAKYDNVLIGRREVGVQPELNLGAYNFNILKDLVLKNICLVSTGAAAPIQNTSASVNNTLVVEDCTVNAAGYIMYDRSTSYDYGTVIFNNSILASASTNTALFIYVNVKKTTKAENYTDFRLTNNVILFSGTPGLGNAYTFRMNSKDADGKFYQMPNLVMTFDHNTIYNLCAGYMIQVGACKQVNFDNNVWESALSTGTSANLFTLSDASAAVKPAPATSTATNNWMYTSNYDGVTYKYRIGTPSSTYFTVTGWNASWKGQSGAGSLLGTVDADKFYFPVNPAKVGSAGASYDTKKWTLRDWSE